MKINTAFVRGSAEVYYRCGVQLCRMCVGSKTTDSCSVSADQIQTWACQLTSCYCSSFSLRFYTEHSSDGTFSLHSSIMFWLISTTSSPGVLSCGLKWWSWSTHTHTHKWALCVPWAVQPCVLADRHVCNCSHVAHFPQAHKGIRPDRSAQANRLINDCKATLLLLLFSLFFFYNSSASSFPCLLSSSPSLYSNKKKISDFVRDWYFLFISKFHLVLFSCVDDFLTAASVTTVWWPLLKHLYIFLFKFFCFHSDK